MVGEMTADEYKALRRMVDSQCAVAQLLGLDKSTLSKRESGERPISIEAALAMECLAMRADPQLVRQLVNSPDGLVKS